MIRIIKKILIGLSIVLNVAFLFYGMHFVWSTKYRAEFNHGINLPETTRVHFCSGSKFVIDGHAKTKLQIHPIQLNKFLSQLIIIHERLDTMNNENMWILSCKPPIGDNLTIKYKSNSSYCNITIDTDWN